MVKEFFRNNQNLLLEVANSRAGKHLLNHKEKYPIFKVTPSAFHYFLGRHKGKDWCRAVFFTSDKVAALFLPPLEQMRIMGDEHRRIENKQEAFEHFANLETKKHKYPYPQIFLDVTDFYPDPHPETNSVDGDTKRSGVAEVFATIRAGAGNNSDDTSAAMSILIYASAAGADFDSISRGVVLFLTSSLGGGASIASANLSLYGNTKNNGLGSPGLDVVSSSPASVTAVGNADYGTLGTTVFGTVAYAAFSLVAYNVIALNANGLAAISKTAVTKYGLRLTWDTTGVFGGVWGAWLWSNLDPKSAETAGQASDPKLSVTYTPGAAGGMPMHFGGGVAIG